MAFRTKTQLESDHFRLARGAAATELQSALTTDAGHIVPDRQLLPG